VLVDDERRREADGVFAAAEDEKATLEGQIDDAIADKGRGFTGALVFDDLDADHETASADVTDDRMFGRPVAETGEDVLALPFGVGHAFAFEDVNGRQCGGDADGIAAEGGGVGAGLPVHDGGARHADAERHARGNTFGPVSYTHLDVYKRQAGGTLTVSAVRAREMVRISVADTGAGLTPEECERLFTPYYTTKQHGTGLGLAIVQSVIADHNGTIAVENVEGGGARFVIGLPLAESAEA